MSHEGIRFTSAEEAERRRQTESRLPVDATTPEAVRVQKTAGTGMDIEWKDGHRSHWTFQWLRDACPCAVCNEERESEGRTPGTGKPATPSPLPLYKPPVRPEAVTPVGRYGISFAWNDGHQHGIYSWEYLRTHCQCEPCRNRSAKPGPAADTN